MTYCLGWRTGKNVIIAADAAITSLSGDDFPLTETSFGESHVTNSKGEKIQERALKVFNIRGKLIFAYTGNTRLADKIALSISRYIDEGSTPLAAVELAIGMNIRPENPGIGLIFSFLAEDFRPVLMSFNVSKQGGFDTHDSIVQAGSVPSEVRRATKDHLSHFVDEFDDAGVKMAKLLAILQSYGRTGPLMVAGVGGVFACVALSAKGVQIQPDILHVFHHVSPADEDLVSVCMRQGCITARRHNTQSGHSLTNKVLGETDDRALQRTATSHDEAERMFAQGRYDFVILQNSDKLTIAIVEMDKRKKHDLIWLEPFSIGARSGLQILRHPDLLSKLQENDSKKDSSVYYFPYNRPSRDCLLIPFYNQSKKDGGFIGLMKKRYPRAYSTL